MIFLFLSYIFKPSIQSISDFVVSICFPAHNAMHLQDWLDIAFQTHPQIKQALLLTIPQNGEFYQNRKGTENIAKRGRIHFPKRKLVLGEFS